MKMCFFSEEKSGVLLDANWAEGIFAARPQMSVGDEGAAAARFRGLCVGE